MRGVVGCMLGFWFVGVVMGQVPPGYEVVRVTETDAARSRPDINNSSTVIWGRRVSNIQGVIEVFRNGIVRIIVDDPMTNGRPAINDVGDFVVLTAPTASGPFDVAIHYVDGTVEVVDVIDAIGLLDINNSGQIVWTDDFSGNSTHTEVFTYDGQDIEQISSNGLQNLVPRINNSGKILFSAFDFATQIWFVYLYDDGNLSLVNDKDVIAQFGDVNDSGHLIWAEFEESIARIMHDARGKTTVIAEGLVIWPTMNNGDEVAYGERNLKTRLTDTVLGVVGGTKYTLPSFDLNCEGLAMNDNAEVAWRGTDGGLNAILLLRRIAPNGDFNHDCKINAYDYAIMENCWTGDGNGPVDGLLADCTRADFDDDGDVDGEDLDSFMMAVTGVEGMVDGCVP